ncbi:DNA polymerase/3'-5' exonuclease PolX [Arachidicoccus ginsenosidivorans]|uniref:DNA polymerase/3'-5' exonuclease PolX n=1 Tax=Arachidicoccus ginsenosidivorans TaxID=496057 RepID=A0A5B8VS48_9BACT|nr:DNA polymerase/3'-5' exonuclease PolX [Arachidicoccus ginsenosidivorans]QEC73405.1 DNA polymerase/3'-5' exonuclease PolX [Arachidicoccus ginsenosidivorans]
MTNKDIAARFKLLAELMELHGESPFKIRSYQNAVRTIEKFALNFKDMTAEQIREIPGIGAAVSAKTLELLDTGHIKVLDQWMDKTPPGIIEMLSVKGLGPKKIIVIWRELGVENLGELLYACEENRLMLLKGFGEKTQNNIKEAILFFQDQAGQFLYAQVEALALELDLELQRTSKIGTPEAKLKMTGQLPRQLPVIEYLEWVTTLNQQQLRPLFESAAMANLYPAPDFEVIENESGPTLLLVKSGKLPALHFILLTQSESFDRAVFFQNCSPVFKEAFENNFPDQVTSDNWNEQDLFKTLGLSPIPVPQREFPDIIQKAKTISGDFPPVITPSDIKGIIHCHSRYSDGGQTLKEMAVAAKSKGFEYLVISDHSKSAGYAGGLQPARILEQHEEIDELNKTLAPFKIFKSIESDILRHGDLDYPPDILSSFDLVIASVHSVLKMDQSDATSRLIKAIENPFTHILGHMTGRLLLSRKGYPLDMEKVLDACRANNVVVELNANPRRLDIDWTYIQKALDKGIMLSIDPDAHSIRGMDDIRYGVLVAQKAGLTARQNLSSFDLDTMQQYIYNLKIK